MKIKNNTCVKFSVLLGSFLLAQSSGFAENIVLRNREATILLNEQGTLLQVEPVRFEPGFSWLGSKQNAPKTEGKKTVYTSTITTQKTPAVVSWTEAVTPEKTSFIWDVKVSCDKDIPLTYMALGFASGDQLNGGEAELTFSDGTTKTYPLPFPRDHAQAISQVVFTGKQGETLTLTIDPPLDAHIDGNIRFHVAGELLSTKTLPHVLFTLETGEAITFYPRVQDAPDKTDLTSWFDFVPKNSIEPNVLGMQTWLHLPKSPLKMKGDQILADGNPFKIWGTNIEYAETAPTAAVAEQTAGWMAKQGVNAVRLHKLTNPGWEGLGSTTSATTYDPNKLKRFDYFTHQLRDRGILYGFSPMWDLKIFEGDRENLIAYDELKKHRGTTTGLVWFMKDIQDLHIETHLNLLNHENPHTGLPYAKDPALAFVEIQNEEDVFFYTTLPNILKYPTYKKLIAEQFSDWLSERYPTQEALASAWGSALNGMRGDGANAEETLKARNILPISNPWLLDHQGKTGARAKRLQDTAEFLLKSQNNYYRRAIKAIRKTGYKGLIITSNWQGGETSGHLLNLYSDSQFGVIDRHNYLAGAIGTPGHEMHTGHAFLNSSTLSDPGAALLSTGMQQVAGKPFSLSEWQATPPHEWTAAETAIIAIYGIGLQGWDMSYFFASNHSGFTPTLQFPGNKKFNNQTPHGIGMFPLLSRMILRGDIQEGEVIARYRITPDQALKQTQDFKLNTLQQHDIKSFSATPMGYEGLAIGRMLIDFGKKEQPSEFKDLSDYKNGDTLTSTSGQLNWTAPGTGSGGYITVNSAGTQGLLGFAPQQPAEMNDLSVTPANDFSVILATALEPNENLSNCKQALVLAIARVRNKGMRLGYGHILDRGEKGIIIEPVKADLTFQREIASVQPLDPDGVLTGKTLSKIGNTVTLDSEKTHAIYYLVTFK